MRAKRTRMHKSAVPRNPELEQILVENPDDIGLRTVFVDWLQSIGDPWGDLIALELAGHHALARRLLNKHPRLLGGLPRDHVVWSNGFIDGITVPLNPANALDRVMRLRTALLVRRIQINYVPRNAIARIPRLRALRDLDLTVTKDITALASPTLERLRLIGWTTMPPLFEIAAVPKLRELEAWTTFSFTHLRSILESPLLPRLDCLVLTLDDPSAAHAIRRADDLAHVSRLMFRNREQQPALDERFRDQFAAYRANARSMML